MLKPRDRKKIPETIKFDWIKLDSKQMDRQRMRKSERDERGRA